MLPRAHAHPVPGAHQVGQAGLQRGALGEGARGEPGDSARVALHVRVHHLGVLELRHRPRQQLLHQQVNDVLVAQRRNSPRVVKVARQHRALRLRAAPQRLLVRLQLVQHEEGAACSTQLRELGQNVGRRVGGHHPVQPDAGGADVDGVQGRGGGQLRAQSGQVWRAGDYRLHALGAQRQHAPVQVVQRLGAKHVVLVLQARDAVSAHRHSLHSTPALHGDVVVLSQAQREGVDDGLRDGAALDPAHVEGGLVRERVVVQQLHRHRCGQLLRGLEKADQQGGAHEVIHEPLAEAHADKELVRGHAVVALKGGGVAVEVQHGVQQAQHRDAVLQRQPPA
mmetsp:Transcript_25788/g.66408  ORF Transcript_25788/g.66408 Transcript_25788/m.66408 type:complete len:338 (+) Transcript_25788:311-1324(+)